MEQDMLSVEDVARMLNVSGQTVRRWHATGYLPPASTGPRRRDKRWAASVITRWIEQSEAIALGLHGLERIARQGPGNAAHPEVRSFIVDVVDVLQSANVGLALRAKLSAAATALVAQLGPHKPVPDKMYPSFNRMRLAVRRICDSLTAEEIIGDEADLILAMTDGPPAEEEPDVEEPDVEVDDLPSPRPPLPAPPPPAPSPMRRLAEWKAAHGAGKNNN